MLIREGKSQGPVYIAPEGVDGSAKQGDRTSRDGRGARLRSPGPFGLPIGVTKLALDRDSDVLIEAELNLVHANG